MKSYLLVFLLLLMVAGCSHPAEAPSQTAKKDIDAQGMALFTSENYSFSFRYPAEWTERTSELPDQWGIHDTDDTVILFMTSPSSTDNLEEAGKEQALRDFFISEGRQPTEEDRKKTEDIVATQAFGSSSWYTYAIQFGGENVSSIVSGTLCNGRQVIMVFVARNSQFDLKKPIYTDMLSSFTCS